MPVSINFYHDALGFEVISTSEPAGDHFDWALLQLNDATLMLNTAYEQASRPPVPHAWLDMRTRLFSSVARM